MKLYNLPPGLNPRRVRIFLAEKGIDIPTVDIDMTKGENHTAEFLAMNPLGTLPVLALDDGAILTESIAICRYLEELHPTPSLFGETPLERAQIEMWNRRVELHLMRNQVDNFVHTNAFWTGRREQVEAYGQLAKDAAEDVMGWLNEELGGREFIAGDRYSVADISAQCSILLGKNTGTPIPPGLPNLSRWWDMVSARPTARA